MAPLILEGANLGQKHRHFNKLINEATQTDLAKVIKEINCNDSDIENIFKIECASRNKDVDFFIKTFKCEDMLYISKTIKRSGWLLSDEYSHIVNPEYLSTQLLPEMITEAQNKLMHFIRIHLKNEKRSEEFFNSLIENEPAKAITRLPYCSNIFIEKNIDIYCSDLSYQFNENILHRLFEKSIKYAYLLCQNKKCYFRKDIIIKCATPFARNDIEIFLDMCDLFERDEIPCFGAKTTKHIMKNYSDKILNNFDKYRMSIDLPTFAECIKYDVKKFILKHIKNGKLFRYGCDEIKHFIKYLPQDDQFNFIKEHFIDKLEEDCSSFANIYIWYKFASFETCFKDLKKLIRIESSSSERHSMLTVILHCADGNPKHINTLLQYYRKNHINEAFMFKNTFMAKLVRIIKIETFDKQSWSLLNEIFSSMEVYNETKNDLQPYIDTIILYKTIHEEPIPNIVQEKFKFSTLKWEQSKMNIENQEKVFQYLHRYVVEKIENLDKSSNEYFDDVIRWLNDAIDLLEDWNRDSNLYIIFRDKLKSLLEISKGKKYSSSLKQLYNKNLSWRKSLFNESIILNPTDDTFINAFKHAPELFKTYKSDIKTMCSDENVLLKRFLKKIRIYDIDLAHEFKQAYNDSLKQKSSHKSDVLGLIILLPQKEMLQLIQNHAPQEGKINWNEVDDQVLSLQKKIAGYMYLARPKVHFDMLLLYAKGDYLQYTLPSLCSILSNLTIDKVRINVHSLLDAPVSFQKHIIRQAIIKLKIDELLEILPKLWKKTDSPTIRLATFQVTYQLLCNQKNTIEIEEVWKLLDMFIDDLTLEENKSIYRLLSKVDKIPLPVRPAFCIKIYKLLKRLPNNYGSGMISSVIHGTESILEHIDSDFMNEVLMKPQEKYTFQEHYDYSSVMASYLLSTKDEQVQNLRYEKTLRTLLHNAKDIWSITENDDNSKKNYAKFNTIRILDILIEKIEDVVIDFDMITPIKLFNMIQNDLQRELSLPKHYVFITSRIIATNYINILEKYLLKHKTTSTTFEVEESVVDNDKNVTALLSKMEQSTKYTKIHAKCIPEFIKICMQQLNTDIIIYSSSIFVPYANALKYTLQCFRNEWDLRLLICKGILDFETKEGYLLAIHLIPEGLYDKEQKKLGNILIKRICSYPDNEVQCHYSMLTKGAFD